MSDALHSTPAAGSRPAPGAEDEAALLRQLEMIERLMDRRFGVLGVRFGLDSVLGLVPGVGDTVTTGVSAYLIWLAHRLGADNAVKTKMARNVALDWVLGLVPLVGDVGDVFFKANTRNVRLLRRHLEERGRLRRLETGSDRR